MASHDTDAGLRRALFAGIFANLGVAIAKFVAFLMTRSAAMLAESLHSVADSSNQLLLLVGLHRSRRPPDEAHPFGFAAERYFWSFVVSINIFLLGALFAIYEGVRKVLDPHPIHDPVWSYLALALATVFEAYALSVAWREFRHFRRESDGSLLESLRDAKDLSLPTVLFEDTAAILGLAIAATGITLSLVTHDGVYDGIASILIGVILLGVAWFLATESHSLLIGESASRGKRATIRTAVEADPAVRRLVELKTLQHGPGHILVALTLEFADDLSTDGVEDAIVRIERAIRDAEPAARHIFVEAGAFRGSRPDQPPETA